jgi:hypothetical protein
LDQVKYLDYLVPRKANENITTYIGEQLTGPESDARHGVNATNPYTIEARDGEPIDAACRRGVAGYVPNHKSMSQANCRFPRGQDGRKWFVATRAVPAGRELTVSYGGRYKFNQTGVSHLTKK